MRKTLLKPEGVLIDLDLKDQPLEFGPPLEKKIFARKWKWTDGISEFWNNFNS